MNSFAALSIDSDDEEVKVTTKKTTAPAAKTAAAPAKKAPVVARVIPGMSKPKAPVAAAAPAAELAAVDPSTEKVNDRGGKVRERYNGHSTPKGAVPADRKAHRDRHDYDRTGRGGGKEATKGGRGPGGWGSADDEARRATKTDGAEEPAVEAEEAEAVVVVEEPVQTVFSFDDAIERRNAARANQALFGAVTERAVAAPSLKVIQKEAAAETVEAKTAKKSQRSNNKTSLVAGFTFNNSTAEFVPRERDTRSAPRNSRDSRGPRKTAGAKLADDEFPAL